MKSAWQELAPRQRHMILAAVFVALAALLYVQVWEPLAQARSLERERIAGQQALLLWLEALEPVAGQLRSAQQDRPLVDGRSLLGLADETARAAGLAGSMTRIEPVGQDEVRVWFEQADFVDVMGWLEQFSRTTAVQIKALQVDRHDRAGASSREGRVNLRVTLAKEGSNA